MAVDETSQDHPAARRLQWMLASIGAPDELTIADLEAVYDTSDWQGWTLADELHRFKTDDRVMRPFTAGEVTVGEGQASVVVTSADDKRWSLTCWISKAEPHRVTGTRLVPAPPEGTTVRDATPADAITLAELERRSPLRLGDSAMYFDRGDDYFASARLMEDVTVYVAEVDNVVAGVYWGAQQPVLVAGEPKLLFLEHHVRIDPQSRRGGVFWALVVYGRDRYAQSADSIAFYVSPDNEAVRKFVEGTPSWPVQPVRSLIPCSADEPPDPPRRATAADAEAIVAILNACHAGEELYVPYTVESLTRRLERSPDQYTWSDIRLGEGAVVGVGRIPVEVTKVSAGASTRSTRSTVLDHGFVEGAASEYARLLRATGAELASQGTTYLAAFSSPGSRAHGALLALAAETEPFDFWAFDIDEPPGLAERGFYVDPVYF